MLKINSTKKFIIFGILTELIYLSFYFLEPFIGFKYIGKYNIFFLVVFLLTVAFVLYLKSFKLIKAGNNFFKLILLFFIIFNTTTLFIVPITSGDIFLYVKQTRVFSHHHTNPYLVSYNQLTSDAFYNCQENYWNKTSPYGPLFILTGSVLNLVFSNNLYLTIFLYKFLFIVCNILIFFFIYKIFKDNKLAFLYAWNPLIIFEFALNGHNDVIMVFLLVLSLMFFLKMQKNLWQYLLAWLFLLLSVLIKFITVIFLPIYSLAVLANLKNRKDKYFFTGTSIFLALSLFFIFYLPFWQGWHTLIGFTSAASQPHPFASVLVGILLIILSKLTITNTFHAALFISIIIFIFSYLILLIRALSDYLKNKQIDTLKYLIFTLAICLATCFSWLRPWYLVILITLLIVYSGLKNSFKYNYIIYGLTIYGIFQYTLMR